MLKKLSLNWNLIMNLRKLSLHLEVLSISKLKYWKKRVKVTQRNFNLINRVPYIIWLNSIQQLDSHICFLLCINLEVLFIRDLYKLLLKLFFCCGEKHLMLNNGFWIHKDIKNLVRDFYPFNRGFWDES